MDFFQSKIQIVKNKLIQRGLYEPRTLSILFLGVIGLAVVWNGIGVVQQNYELSRKIAVIEEENQVLALENANRALQIEYFKTPEFAELKARRVNGRAAKGEKIYT